MTKKATKRALLSSALALVVCISMLIGTTYAWFTDSVTSANNIITSGNLDVELYYQVEGQTDWTKVDENTNIFKENALWEPGHTEVVKLKVVNEGTLALKYQLGVNIASEVGSTNVFDKEFKLSEYIKYAVIDGEQNYTRDTAVAAAEANNATALKSAYNSGTTELKAKDSTNSGEKIVTMVVYMPTTVGNEANYKKGFAVPTINLGINLFATQVEAESDSFGDDYDEDAWNDGFKVYSADDLQDAIDNGKDVVLMNNIEADDDIYLTANLDLGGYTLSADYISAAEDVKIVNGTLEMPKDTYLYAQNGVTITIEDVIIDSDEISAYAAVGGTLVLKNVTFENTATSNPIQNYGGTLVMDNVTVAQSGDANTAWYSSAIQVINKIVKNEETGKYQVTAQANTTINSGTYEGKTAIFVSAPGGNVTINGGTFKGSEYAINAQFSPQNYIDGNNYESVITINGGDFTGALKFFPATKVVITGGTFTVDPSAYLSDDFKAINNNGKFYVVSKTTDAVVSTPAEIKTALSNAAAAGSGDSIVYLAGDIDMTGAAWTPIKVDGYNGAGVVTIEGNGATIKGLNAPLFAGGFAGKSGIVIKNLTIADSTIVSTSGLGGGAFIDTADSMQVVTLENCHLINSTVSGERAGGLIGWCSGYAKLNDGPVKTYVTISDCSVVDSTIIGNGSAGGIAGHPGASDYTYTTIEDCAVKGVKVISYEPISSWRTGAIVGTANNGHVVINNVAVENVTLTQDGVTSEETKLYGRFVPSGTGTLVIDGANVVDSAAALATALTADEKEISVMLANDIDLPISTLGTITGGSGEYKLGGESTEKINIDLNGKKLNITTTYWSVLGAKNANAIFTIKNGTMTSSQATGTWNSYDLAFANCDYVIENVNFEKAIAFTNANKTVNIKNVTIKETHDYYAMWISAKGQTVEIDNLTVISSGRGIKIDEQYVDAPAKVTLNIKNSKFTTAKKAAILVKSVAGAAITVENFDISNVSADSVNAVWVDSDAAASANKVTVNGNAAVVEQ